MQCNVLGLVSRSGKHSLSSWFAKVYISYRCANARVAILRSVAVSSGTIYCYEPCEYNFENENDVRLAVF